MDRRSMPLAATLAEGLCSATAKSWKVLNTITFAGLIAATSLLPAAAFSPAAAVDSWW
jgi:hypothetical protein